MSRFKTSLIVVALVVVTGVTSPLLAARPGFGRLFYDDQIVRTIVPPAAMPNEGLDTLYVVENGVPGQLGIAAVAPGDTDYHGGKWAFYQVTWNVAPLLLTSEADVLAAAAAGDVTVVRLAANDFKCPIQPTVPGQSFVAVLAGDEAGTSSRARGVALFHFDPVSDQLRYKLIVSNIQDIWMAHIHMAPQGSNGPIVVWLFPSMPPPPPNPSVPGRFSGTLAEGTITADDLVGPLLGTSLSDLIAEIDNDQTYVNVHTLANPSGEIRGQIFGDN